MTKLGQYADDTFVILDGSTKSLQETILTFKQFYQCSGLKMNLDKTHAVWLGNKANCNDKLCDELRLSWVSKFNLLGIEFSTVLKDIVPLNYAKKIVDMEKLLLQYKKHNLTLMGKVTVVKTLAIPKIVYLLTCLPLPCQTLLERIQKMLKSFIWETTVRISLKQLEKDVCEGGLKLTNILCFNKSLKLTWIKRILNTNGDWQRLFEYSCGLNKKYFFELDPISIEAFIPKFDNPFWSELCRYWSEYKMIFIDELDSRSFPIWNSHFLHNANIVQRKVEFVNKGLIYINDLLSQTGDMMGYQEFIDKYRICINFVDFYSLIHSIPREWRINYTDRLGVIGQNVINVLSNCKKICRYVYPRFLSLVNSDFQRNHHLKWSNIVGRVIDEKEWAKYYMCNSTSCIETRMRNFQYQILLRSLPTNRYLKQCGIKQSDACYFCKQNIETIEHLFWSCVVTNSLWDDLQRYLYSQCNINITLNKNIVCLGFIESENNRLINHILNITKRYIYVTKCNEGSLHLSSVLSFIKYHYTLEKIIVDQNQKNEQLRRDKWQAFTHIFE